MRARSASISSSPISSPPGDGVAASDTLRTGTATGGGMSTEAAGLIAGTAADGGTPTEAAGLVGQVLVGEGIVNPTVCFTGLVGLAAAIGTSGPEALAGALNSGRSTLNFSHPGHRAATGTS